MIRLCAIFLAVTSLARWSVAQNAPASPPDAFRQGVESCQAGEYTKAIRAFQESLTAQPAAGTLLNLGIAQWRNGEAGEALLSWEQAAWMDPFSRAARGNLRFARQVVDVEGPELRWYETVSTWLPADAWAWLTGISLWLAVGMVTLPGILRWRRAGWHQPLAAIGLGVFLFCIPAHIGIITRSHLGIVVGNDTALRLAPAQEADVTATLTAGEAARALRSRGNYVLVRTQNGLGWIERNGFALICPR